MVFEGIKRKEEYTLKNMISICIITRNEEENLRRCLDSLKNCGMPVVVVDTGSTDHSREVALQAGAKVADFQWCDDFSAARNYGMTQVDTEFVMMLDSDEYLVDWNADKLKQLCGMLQQYPDQVGRIYRRNILYQSGEVQENREWINRIFSKKRFRYQGRIHEQITSIERRDYEMFHSPVVIMHTGYDAVEDQRQKKAKRNIHLLLEELQTTPEDPYILYQLGKSYYMLEDYEKSSDYFSQALNCEIDAQLEYKMDLIETYGYALLKAGRPRDALQLEAIYEQCSGSADFHLMMGLVYMNNTQFDRAVESFMEATRYQHAKAQGANTYLAYYNAGVVRECLGDFESARRYYLQAGEYDKALQGLRRVVPHCGKAEPMRQSDVEEKNL